MPDPESQPPATSSARAYFTTTHWSVVLRAGQSDAASDREALGALCRAYWRPLYAFARRLGQGPADAEDLTQGFFARLIEKNDLADACREKGRFRTFLLTAFKRFLANEWDRQHAQKRGGFQPALSIDSADAEARLGALGDGSPGPDVLFERQWALSLLELVMERLREEYAVSGRMRLFEQLRPCLGREETAPPYAQTAAELHLTEAAVKMAVRRLRARYRELLREEIARTISDPGEVDDEIRHLFATFSD